MKRTVTTPDGTRWTVERRLLPWRLRRRKRFDPDPPELLLWLLSFPLLALEAVVAGLVCLVELARHAAGKPWRLVASSTGPPARRMGWTVRGGAASRERVAAIARGFEADEDVAATAEWREAGAKYLRARR